MFDRFMSPHGSVDRGRLHDVSTSLSSEPQLAALAWQMARSGALSAVTPDEERLLSEVEIPDGVVQEVRARIASGADPLGDTFCALRSAAVRRPDGAVYTPDAVVDVMVAWGQRQAPGRVVDPGAGSGRFLVAAGRALPNARLPIGKLGGWQLVAIGCVGATNVRESASTSWVSVNGRILRRNPEIAGV